MGLKLIAKDNAGGGQRKKCRGEAGFLQSVESCYRRALGRCSLTPRSIFCAGRHGLKTVTNDNNLPLSRYIAKIAKNRSDGKGAAGSPSASVIFEHYVGILLVDR